MAMVRSGQFIGRLTRDPDQPKVLPNSGTTLVSFGIACGRSKKNQSTGEWEDDPNVLYVDCKVYTSSGAKFNLAQLVADSARKGSEVYVAGELKAERWDDKQTGQKREKLVLEVRDFQLLGGKTDQKPPINHEDPGETMTPRQPARQTHPSRTAVQPVEDSDIPF